MMKEEIMKGIRNSCLLLLTIAVLLGCAGFQASVSHTRQGNEIIYEDQKSGRHVKVAISQPFEYKDFIAREAKGVALKGYLFVRNEDQVLVTRVHRDDFQTLTGISIATEAADFVQFDPFTFFDKPDCEFVRTHIHTVSEFLIIAAYFKRLDSNTYPCYDWLSVDDVAAAEPELLDAFNLEADDSVQMSGEK